MSLGSLAAAKGIDFGGAIWNTPGQFGNATYMGHVKDETAFIGPENDMKAAAVLAVRGQYNFSAVQPLIDWARANNKRFYLNTLIWGNWQALPEWLRTRNFTPAELKPIMAGYIKACIEKVPDALGVHVVNEAFANGPSTATFQGIRVVDDWGMRAFSYENTAQPIPWYVIPDYDLEAFKAAAAADPLGKIPLGYNDYATDLDGETWRREKILNRLEYLLTKGARINFFGHQCHVNTLYNGPNASQFSAFVDDLARLGLWSDITELDYQAGSEARLNILLSVVRDNKYIRRIQCWEFGGPAQYNFGTYQTVGPYNSSFQKTALYTGLEAAFTSAVARAAVVTPPPTMEPPPTMPTQSPAGSRMLVVPTAAFPLTELIDADGASWKFADLPPNPGWTLSAGHRCLSRNGVVQKYTNAVIAVIDTDGRVTQTYLQQLNLYPAGVWYHFTATVTAGQAAAINANPPAGLNTAPPPPVDPPVTDKPVDRAAALAQYGIVASGLVAASSALAAIASALAQLKVILDAK